MSYETMNAYELHSVGNIENLVFTRIPVPVIKDYEVLIENKAISINPVDVQVRQNKQLLQMLIKNPMPVILGWDIAGIVSKVGKRVSQFKVGERVFGMINFPGHGKAYAEYVAAPEYQLSKIPRNIDFESAATTSLAGLIAFQVISKNIKPGSRVLIHGGSGGVGHFAIQIAKQFDAFVISTSSSRNRDFILSLGADEHIDYKTQDFEKIVSNVDFVLDSQGGEILKKSIQAVKHGGIVVSLRDPDIPKDIFNQANKKAVNLSFSMVQSDTNDLRMLSQMLENESLKPYVSRVYGFKELKEAHRHIETGRAVGKVAVRV